MDIRPRIEFRVGHFASAISCPLSQLAESIHLLPDKHRRLWVFGSEGDVPRALQLLRQRGYVGVEPHPAATPYASPRETVESAWVSGDERVRLWEPNPFLSESLNRQTVSPGEHALDVACGGGRNTCWLSLAGLRAHGVDKQPDALSKARTLVSQAWRALDPGAGKIEKPGWIVADLEKSWPFAAECFDWVVCFRFLWRSLLPEMARSLKPGGTLVYQTFTVEQRRFGKPQKAEYLFEPGELRHRFEKLGLRTLDYQETCPPRGPALASLLATRDT